MIGEGHDAPSAGGDPGQGADVKAAADTLRLRARTRPVVRFRRGLLIGAAAVGAVGLTAFAWLALSPRAIRLAGPAQEPAADDRRAPANAVASLPSDYTAQRTVPMLGPPLPGDLGHAVVDQERRRLSEGSGAEQAERSAAQQAAEAERQRLAAQTKQAREAGVMIQTASPSSLASTAPAAPVQLSAPGVTGFPAEAPASVDDPNRQQQKAAFLERTPSAGPSADRLAPPASPYAVMAGSVIAASLITGLNSDLPGLVTAQVTENVFDSVSGRFLLIPQGSRLIGSYDSVVVFGQSRALVVWQRLILPNGASIVLDNLPATDAGGYAGLSDKVDFHTWRLLKGVAMSTLLGVGTELSLGGDESDLVRAIRQSTQQSSAQAGQQIVSKQLDVQPTLQVRPGWPLRLVVHKDLILRPWPDSRR
ncbi:TrbI/VirB10 family protein [Caulobacter sp. Root1455]|uniref:TrbI/VirB10 family protein n=1 Tax=Caulobacter sp. Root1455 TaxID=1736465 RepID=UPI0009EC173B|nr:TrbI/VirB10 family protein [Caulobacter sp. Root1455]